MRLLIEDGLYSGANDFYSVQNKLFSDSQVSLNLYRISSNFIEIATRCDFE